MAPRKEKKEQATGDKATDLILSYLRKQNRPYSVSSFQEAKYVHRLKQLLTRELRQATDISNNLHNEVTKAQTAKLLKEMHERGEVEGRAAGKQNVYHTIQDLKDAASPEELVAMDREIEAVREEIIALKSKQKTLHSTLATLRSTPTTSSLRESIGTLSTELEAILECLLPLRSGTVSPVSAEERTAVDKAFANAQRKSILRKKIFKSLWDMTCDNLPDGTNKSDLWERLGFEDDP